MKKLIPLILIFLIFISFEGKAQSDEKKDQKFELVKSLIESKNYEFEGDWAYPLRGTSINLIGNPNSLEIKGDSVDIYLPFFGVSRISGYENEGGFKYEGPVKDYVVDYNEKKNKIIINFTVQDRSESLDITITAFSKSSVDVNVNSDRRDVMKYRGRMQEPEKSE
tara:strand:+ start:2120 stop:2617 length:498 start_codon:yes stop_codon:yes gene_type:complete